MRLKNIVSRGVEDSSLMSESEEDEEEEASEVILSRNVVEKKKKKNLRFGEEEEEERRDGLVLLAQSTQMVRSRSQGTTRRVTPTPLVDVEKPLPNGDLYIGSFSGGFPHGSGKYL
ncbi:unnamed protein product [Arabidopsis lyrata]|nr:unnamed protein product [Arabidopsis lyrata]